MTDKPNGVKPKNEDPVILNPVADDVTIKSSQGVISLVFMTSHLDPKVLANHKMILSTILMHKNLAKSLGLELIKHAERGEAEVVIKKHPLPEGMKLPDQEKK